MLSDVYYINGQNGETVDGMFVYGEIDSALDRVHHDDISYDGGAHTKEYVRSALKSQLGRFNNVKFRYTWWIGHDKYDIVLDFTFSHVSDFNV
ncbi:hypothetical protein H4219_004984 [Mycoemilia scoparia]|uniref:Uncharacterized protein n=1 Tax=Mycoemilia scoparia TaxID=417184 RepID=A0A9W8DKM1_9FUNG|nr:hypothetical protein H4219_004984 [Mycoemilia scoparia]